LSTSNKAGLFDIIINGAKNEKSPDRPGVQTVNKAKKYHLWARRALPAQPTPCGFAPFRASVSSLRGTSKTGKLSKNLWFFDKLKSPDRPGDFA